MTADETTSPGTFVAIDGTDALFGLVLRQVEGGRVQAEMFGSGLPRHEAARYLRMIADDIEHKAEADGETRP